MRCLPRRRTAGLYLVTGFWWRVTGCPISGPTSPIGSIHSVSTYPSSPTSRFAPDLEVARGRFQRSLRADAAAIGFVPSPSARPTIFSTARSGADVAIAIACLAAILINEPLPSPRRGRRHRSYRRMPRSFTFDRTQSAIGKLAELFPFAARCCAIDRSPRAGAGGSGRRSGRRQAGAAEVPVRDGVVRDGQSAVDASAPTGESLPADKKPGDEVLAGSVNEFGGVDHRGQSRYPPRRWPAHRWRRWSWRARAVEIAKPSRSRPSIRASASREADRHASNRVAVRGAEDSEEQGDRMVPRKLTLAPAQAVRG